MGKLLFGFLVFWAYITFSQFMLIWYAALPEETTFYHHRWDVGPWANISLLLVFAHFIIPFFFLLSRNVKRRLYLLRFAAAWLIVMHVVEMYWLVMPNYNAGILGDPASLWIDAVLPPHRRRSLSHRGLPPHGPSTRWSRSTIRVSPGPSRSRTPERAMASDQSPPRVRPIAITAFVALAILVSLKFVFDSYYLKMFRGGGVREDRGPCSRRTSSPCTPAEKRNLTTSAIPIDRAMSMLAKSREQASAGMADGGITPEQSTDTNALIGWQKLPQKLTAAELAEGTDAGAATMGGAMTDGGATPALALDGGNSPTGSGALLDASARS